MKVTRIAGILGSFLLLGLASCSSVPGGSLVSSAVGAGALGGAMGGKGAAIAAPAVTDFQSGELLASQDNGDMNDAIYYVAKILQPASPATNNQAQAIFVSDGKKYWVNFVLDSRKATNADFVVGASVLYMRGWSNHDEISADTYRKQDWAVGSVTSVNDLFKGRVEIDGDSYAVKYLRIPVIVGK